ncbi:MAG: hypothetical protein AMJ75_08535 [Phycisphaerae bacterium SM1_79]|nr:MAG: hypothetical protein AMJ75_08535 [Phycisphaerae bacterium SM1_79]
MDSLAFGAVGAPTAAQHLIALVGVRVFLEADIACALPVHDQLADIVGAHVQNRGELARDFLGLVDDSGLSFDDLDLIAGGEHPAPAIKDRAALGLQAFE